MNISLDRRQMLATGGALVVGFAFAHTLSAIAQPAAGKSLANDALDSYLVIAPDGAVTLYSGKVDLGTGARAAYRQIVAEDLDIAFARVDMIDGDTGLTPDQGGTGGSTGITGGGMQIRQAAATARQALLGLAAKKFGVAANELSVADGVVKARDGRSATYGELIGGGAGPAGNHFDVKLDKAAAL